MAVAAATPSALASAPAPTVRTDDACYLVGQRVTVSGAGFASSSLFDIAIDDVDFGQSFTTSTGAFTSVLVPGGLGAGQVQSVDQLDASDGVSDGLAEFTLTRPLGARFDGGSSLIKHAPFQVWDFAPTGGASTVYVHYQRTGSSAADTVKLGKTSGQCGTLRTSPRRFFPFTPAAGTWTLQFDTRRAYLASPGGPVARLTVHVH
jgi:hypothetical protein